MNKNGDGGAESYEGVSIEWIRGNDPIMTVYDDGVEQEVIDLTKIKTIPDMHQMMVDKGFIKGRIREDKEVIQKETDEETALVANEAEKKKLMVRNEAEKKTFVRGAVEKEEVDHLQSAVRKQKIMETRSKKGNQVRFDDQGQVVESHTPKNYTLLVPVVIFAIFAILRYRKRRRSRRHTV